MQTSILQDRQDKIMFFSNISEARALLSKANATTIALTMRIAADEACADPLAQVQALQNHLKTMVKQYEPPIARVLTHS